MLRSWCTHSQSSITDLVVFFWATNRMCEPPPFTSYLCKTATFWYTLLFQCLRHASFLQASINCQSENWMFVIARQAFAKETAALCDSSTLSISALLSLKFAAPFIVFQGSWFFFPPKILFLGTRQKDGPASPREVWNDITRCGYMPIFPLQHWEQ